MLTGHWPASGPLSPSYCTGFLPTPSPLTLPEAQRLDSSSTRKMPSKVFLRMYTVVHQFRGCYFKRSLGKWDRNIRYDTIKFLEGNVGKTSSTTIHTSDFLGQSPKVIEIKAKINKWDLIKFTSFYTAKGEKAMAPHSSSVAEKIPWMEPGRLQSMGSLRVGHDWATSLSLSYSKGNHKRKRHLQIGIFANYMTDKGLISKICKQKPNHKMGRRPK